MTRDRNKSCENGSDGEENKEHLSTNIVNHGCKDVSNEDKGKDVQ